MKVIFKLTVLIIVFSHLLPSCRKIDTHIERDVQALFYKATDYLKQKKIDVSPSHSRKIDTLISSLLDKNTISFTVGKTGVLICDLRTYKNVTIPEYKHSYYKAYFRLKDGKIEDAYIYTIHTNLSEEEVNVDIENILLFKSKKFSGQIVTNATNDNFILAAKVKNGKIEKVFDVQTKEPPTKGLMRNTSTDNCAYFYLVTTTYWSDGSISKEWDFLYRLCGACNTNGQPVDYFVPDCDPQNGVGTANYTDTANPCANADSLAANTDYKSRLDSLKTSSTQSYETGYYSTKNSDGTFTYHKQQGSNGGSSINQISVTTPIRSLLHNHYTGLLSVFSGTDLQSMYNLMKSDKMDDPGKFSMSLVTASGTAYMLQIDNIGKFSQFGKKWMADPTWFAVFETLYSQNYGITTSSSNDTNLNGFLRMLSEYNTGLKFFVGDNTTFSQWSPKAFQSDGALGGSIINSPCN